MKPQGRKEVGEAVVIAALSALATQAITWGFETLKRLETNRRERKEKEKE
jgi:hypothetical protein